MAEDTHDTHDAQNRVQQLEIWGEEFALNGALELQNHIELRPSHLDRDSNGDDWQSPAQC
jgi:hypothetical protein